MDIANWYERTERLMREKQIDQKRERERERKRERERERERGY